MNDLIVNENKIENLIYEIRGKQVMLDRDLATLYGVETKRINEAVKNNLDKFPERFSWILTREDSTLYLRSKISTSSEHGGRRYNYRVFTEQGVAMLATILKSKQAVQISIQIMDAFVAMRKYISTNLIEQKYVNEIVFKHEERINTLEETFSRFDEKKKINEIYFNGQIYDAYSKLVDIMKESKKSLVIIDGYADKTVLDMIANLKVKTTLIIKPEGLLKKIDITKYNEQYHNLNVIHNNTFHDRYIIIDDKIIYHCGASLNYAGCKTFSINLLKDDVVVKNILEKIKEIIS